MMALIVNLLRRPWIGAHLSRMATTDACAFSGHPAKIDKPPDEKSKGQRGCVCGARDWI
jgi:hypothetical protein